MPHGLLLCLDALLLALILLTMSSPSKSRSAFDTSGSVAFVIGEGLLPVFASRIIGTLACPGCWTSIYTAAGGTGGGAFSCVAD